MPIEEQAAADLRQLRTLATAVIRAAQQHTGQVDILTKRHSELYETIRITSATDTAYSKAYRHAWERTIATLASGDGGVCASDPVRCGMGGSVERIGREGA